MSVEKEKSMKKHILTENIWSRTLQSCNLFENVLIFSLRNGKTSNKTVIGIIGTF